MGRRGDVERIWHVEARDPLSERHDAALPGSHRRADRDLRQEHAEVVEVRLFDRHDAQLAVDAVRLAPGERGLDGGERAGAVQDDSRCLARVDRCSPRMDGAAFLVEPGVLGAHEPREEHPAHRDGAATLARRPRRRGDEPRPPGRRRP
ncbi:MAG: hypothetical protein R3C15_04080 [Thermoleophilia bacterium]